MSTPAQLTPIHRRAMEVAVGNTQVAKDICDKLDGLGRTGTLGPSSTYAATDDQATGNDHVTKLTLTALPVSVVDHTSNGGYGGTKLYTFPEGLIRMKGAVVDLTFTTTSGLTTALKFSLGTIVAATNDTLSLTKANIVPSTGGTITAGAGSMRALGQAAAITALTDSSGGTAADTIPAVAGSYTQADMQTTFASFADRINQLIARLTLLGNGLDALLDGTATAIDVYLNVSAINANSSADATVLVTGTVYLAWEWIGDK